MWYHELLKSGETVNTDRHGQKVINLNHALIEKRPEVARRHGKVIKIPVFDAMSEVCILAKLIRLCEMTLNNAQCVVKVGNNLSESSNLSQVAEVTEKDGLASVGSTR